jgi:hypothetical protein
MTRTINLSDNVYRKLTRSAADRGLTVEVWLELLTDAAGRPTAEDRRRGRKVEQLLNKRHDGTATDDECETLDRLIDDEYRVAIERADARITAKQNGGAGAASKSKRTAPAIPVRRSGGK